MSKVQIFGATFSSYVWSARMALHEKGVSYDLVPNMPNTPDQLAVHPFGRVPALRHGDFLVYESPAILEYINEAFGSSDKLMPADSQERARMRQWMSVLPSYLYPPIVGRVVIQRVFVQANGGAVDENDIAAAVAQGHERLGIINAALGEKQWLAGGDLSLADLLYAPVIFYASAVPDGEKLLAGHDHLKEWLDRMKSRPSFQETMPKM